MQAVGLLTQPAMLPMAAAMVLTVLASAAAVGLVMHGVTGGMILVKNVFVYFMGLMKKRVCLLHGRRKQRRMVLVRARAIRRMVGMASHDGLGAVLKGDGACWAMCADLLWRVLLVGACCGAC